MYRIYFDESGNTGTNWLDEKQPYFVYGGWLIENCKLDSAIKCFHTAFSSSQATEIKSKNILKRQRYIFYNWFNDMTNQARAIPVFIIADKHFMIAAKIVETFFDSEYNPNINPDFNWQVDLKKMLAEVINKNEIIIGRFQELIKCGIIELETMKVIKDLLFDYFSEIGLLEVADTIKLLNDESLLEMIDEYKMLSHNGTEKKNLSLFKPAIFQLILNVDRFCQRINTRATCTADSLFSFDSIINELQEIIHNNILITTIDSIEMKDSKTHEMIQAADLLCGYIRECLNKTDEYANEDCSKELWSTLIGLHDVCVKSGFTPWDYWGDDQVISKISLLSGFSYNSHCNPIDMIKEQFPQFII